MAMAQGWLRYFGPNHRRGCACSVVASGGAGHPEHLREVLTEGKADAALVASMVHYGDFTIRDIKRYLHEQGVKVRLESEFGA